MPIVLRMPEVLTGMQEGVLVQWLVELGSTVTEGQPVAEVETDKAVVEYLAETGGTLAELLVQPGQTVAVGAPIAVLARDGAPVQLDPDPACPTTQDNDAVQKSGADIGTAGPKPAHPQTVQADDRGAALSATTLPHRQFATPLVRRLAQERGIDLTVVQGSGPHGRIVRRDLDRLARTQTVDHRTEESDRTARANGQAATAPPTTAAPSPVPEGTDIEITAMRRAIARRLTESKTTIPHFYLQADCRADALLSLRESVNKQRQAPVSVNDFVIKAVAYAFTEVPDANAIWADTTIRRFRTVDVGVAVSIDGGLVTPVLRDVGRKSLSTISVEARDVATRARAGRLRQTELEGGSFCVSNLGMHGIERFAAIINPPQAGILAVGAANPRPAVIDGELTVATVMTVTLSGDHRVFDGALAAQWLTAFVAAVEQPLTLLV